MKVLHITAHLGGGVGKVLSRLAAQSAQREDDLQHIIACLETPEKSDFVNHVRMHGGKVLICPERETLDEAVGAADIVQLEWWHHPVVAAWLGTSALLPMRLVVWSHISGLYMPALPLAFVTAPHRFLFSSPCTWSHPEFAALSADLRGKVDAVFSSGGFDDLPDAPVRPMVGALRVGYLGTLNFAKLHPRLLDFVAAVDMENFRLVLVGDPSTGEALLDEAARRGLSDRLEIRGYRSDVAAELSSFDVLAYLLSPLHYGTTENALLEAMAMGVIPIVLDNPAERCLVHDGETGLIVDSPQTFAAALTWLSSEPGARKRLSHAADQEVRQRFAIEHTAERLLVHYQAMMAEEKRTWDFQPIFGARPADWFRSCQGPEAWRFQDDGTVDMSGAPPPILYEANKGSVFHYQRTFPDDSRLASWAQAMMHRLG
ncbi:MAG: glycosyltransferase family 4 protein [Candidatus Competibacteraceae bacterium]|nr:glycosyltransferase family 4 protein [Candidatus Competibacteraceae bacterium]